MKKLLFVSMIAAFFALSACGENDMQNSTADGNKSGDNTSVIDDAGDAVKDVGDGVADGIEDIGDGITNGAEDVIDGTSDGVKDMTGNSKQ